MLSFLTGGWGRLVGALALAAALAWACHLIYKAGGDAREAPWLQRESKANAEAAAKIKAASDRAQQIEAEANDRIKTAATAYLQENERAKAENDRLNACLRSGACRMRFAPAQPPSGGPAASGTAGDPARSDGEASCYVPAETAVALRDIGAEADTVARQLDLAQETIEIIIKACTMQPATP